MTRDGDPGQYTLSPPPSTMLGTRPALLVALAAALTCVNAFYLPGAAPRNYAKGDRVDLFVNALTPLENKESAKLVRTTVSYERTCLTRFQRSLLNCEY
jgi:hypothetical protein